MDPAKIAKSTTSQVASYLTSAELTDSIIMELRVSKKEGRKREIDLLGPPLSQLSQMSNVVIVLLLDQMYFLILSLY